MPQHRSWVNIFLVLISYWLLTNTLPRVVKQGNDVITGGQTMQCMATVLENGGLGVN